MEPEIKRETLDAAIEAETGPAGTEPEEYFEEIMESVMEESTDISVTEEARGALSAPEIQIDDVGAVEIVLLIKSTAAEEPMPLPTLENALLVLLDLTREMGGDILSVEYEKETTRPRHITVEIPAENYTLFLARLYLVGEPLGEPLSTTAQEKEFVSFEIELITSF